jgi:hypothetical protein
MTLDLSSLKALAKAATRISENDSYVKPFSTLSTFHDVAEAIPALVTELETLRAAVDALTAERDALREALVEVHENPDQLSGETRSALNAARAALEKTK